MADKITQDTKLKITCQRLLALALGVALAFVIAELACTLLVWIRYGTLSVPQLIAGERRNRFLPNDRDAPYLKTLFPHPYLGFVHNRQFGGESINNIGLMGGRDVPLVKDAGKFTILVTGGSVAAQFAQMDRTGPRYLEELLEQTYDFGPTSVVVLCGADGAWKQPQQTIMLALYGDVVDAVISLDGFNEHYSVSGKAPSRLEYPANNFHSVNPLARQSMTQVILASIGTELYVRSRRSRVVAHSRFAYLLSRHTILALERWVDEGERGAARDVTSVESIFSLPKEWCAAKRTEFNMAQYKKYIRLMHAMAEDARLPHAFFIQPVPAISKTWSFRLSRGIFYWLG